MTILVPNTGEIIALNYMIGKSTSPENLVYKLFATNVTPAESDTAGSYTEAAGGGYASKTLIGSSWSSTAGAPSNASYAQQTYTFTGALSGNPTIYGYFVTRATSSDLCYAETFANFTPTNNGDQVLLTPNLTCD